MKNKGTKQKVKKKGSENAFGCDLIEHLQTSGQDVPQVLRKCAEFIEEHGVVDGIYRLSGVTSNIQRLRQEFCSEACPDLTKEVYLQDIHCVGSLCKLYFRELPNPLLTYELYSKFTDVVSVQGNHERLVYIQKIIRELPTPHFRTLEYLTKHLAHLATLSTQTNMHTRNLALVWAPNLLRSNNIDASSGNGDMAFQEVRIQQSVIEFILNHTDQIFSSGTVQPKPREAPSLLCGEKYATLPISGQCSPMKLMSLEEAQARSLGPNHPVHRERQRENSLPDTSTATLYHTVIDISDSKRKFSGKSKKWKSIFNLGRSVDSKGKLSRNGSVFIRAQGMTEKSALRPSRSMESLCSLPTDDDRTGNSAAAGPGSLFLPDVKSRTLGSDYDLNEHDQNWEFKGKKSSGAAAAWSSSVGPKCSPGASASPQNQKTLPEQLKVFKGDDLGGYRPTSPKNRRMLYSGSSHNSSSRPSFPGSFFPLESSPRHQRRAVNISEPFAVSVPLRVSAVISSNSTPCRGHAKEKASALKPCKETSEPSLGPGKSNSLSQLEPKTQEETERKNTEEPSPTVTADAPSKETKPEGQEETKSSAVETQEGKEPAPSPGEELHKQPITGKLDNESAAGKDLGSHLHQELKITEPEIDLLNETFTAVFGPASAYEGSKLTVDVKSKRSRSSPSLSLLCREPSSYNALSDRTFATGSTSAKKQPSESDIVFSLHKNFDLLVGGESGNSRPVNAKDEEEEKQHGEHAPVDSNGAAPFKTESCLDEVQPKIPSEEQRLFNDGPKRIVLPDLELIQRLSVCVEEKRLTLELPNLDDDEGNSEELDLVEPWEDLSSTKQWVTSPLHSPDVEELFNQLLPFSSAGVTATCSEEEKVSAPPADTDSTPGNNAPTSNLKPETKWKSFPSAPTRISNSSQPHPGKCNPAKQKNTASSHRFHRQMSCETTATERREENGSSKHRPYSLNLDLGYRCIRDISNQQNRHLSEFSSGHRGMMTSSASVNSGLHSDLEMFLNDRQAPLRRNSAPVSVSSVRAPLMIKTCQAKAVPVVPPKVQYSLIPHSRHEKDVDALKEQEKESSKEKIVFAPVPSPPPQVMSHLKEELENKEPLPKTHQKHTNVEKTAEALKTTAPPELPVITRRHHPPSLEVFVDCPRANKGNLLQRPSFRNRQRPQSLILLSPPFPIMDFPTSGDDGKLLSSIKGQNDASAANVFSRETAEGIPLQNKMTIPKSGQRLETSTSCFYQPQRRSMIFDSRSHRQIE